MISSPSGGWVSGGRREPSGPRNARSWGYVNVSLSSDQDPPRTLRVPGVGVPDDEVPGGKVPGPDRATLTVERDGDVGIGPDLRDRLAREHRQVLALEGERVGHPARESNRNPLVPPIDPSGAGVLRRRDHDRRLIPRGELRPEHQRGRERVPERVPRAREDRLVRQDDACERRAPPGSPRAPRGRPRRTW